jgi:hypothetical protein
MPAASCIGEKEIPDDVAIDIKRDKFKLRI